MNAIAMHCVARRRRTESDPEWSFQSRFWILCRPKSLKMITLLVETR